MRYQFKNCLQVLDILGSPDDIAKQNAPLNSGSVKEAAVREEAVCTVRGLSTVFFSPRSWRQRWKFRSIGMFGTSAEPRRKVIFFQTIVGERRWSEDWKKQILCVALLSNGTALHFELMKVSHSISFVVKVIAHFPCVTLLSVAILTNISNCMPNSIEPFSTADRRKLCRYIRGSDRKAAKEVLKHKLSRLHPLERLKHLDPKALESGCKDGCPSKDVLKQIRCEGRRIDTPDENVWLALQKLKKTSIKNHGTTQHCR